jgi:hypothetical protein
LSDRAISEPLVRRALSPPSSSLAKGNASAPSFSVRRHAIPTFAADADILI